MLLAAPYTEPDQGWAGTVALAVAIAVFAVFREVHRRWWLPRKRRQAKAAGASVPTPEASVPPDPTAPPATAPQGSPASTPTLSAPPSGGSPGWVRAGHWARGEAMRLLGRPVKVAKPVDLHKVAKDGAGWLYVVEFSNGVVKVGKTGNPGNRMKAHVSDASPFARVVDQWLSVPHLGYAANEDRLIDACGAEPGASPIKREYFTGITFGRAVELATLIVESGSVAPAPPPVVADGDPRVAVIQDVLNRAAVAASVTGVTRGAVVTRYEVTPAPGTRPEKITGLDKSYMVALKAQVRVALALSRGAIGIEVPAVTRSVVRLPDVLRAATPADLDGGPLTLALGMSLDGPVIVNLAKMPHLLIAGATDTGKSGVIDAILANILDRCTPDQVRLVLIDPKQTGLKPYRTIPHLAAPIVTAPAKAAGSLRWVVSEMEGRFAALANQGSRNIESFNRAVSEFEAMHYLVVIIDELADVLAASPEAEEHVCKIGAQGRSVGVHLVLATQRPTVDVVTGKIKANIPSRLALMTATAGDSRVILDRNGAEVLVAGGDALLMTPSQRDLVRFQVAYQTEDDVCRLVEGVSALTSPASRTRMTRDDLDGMRALFEAARLVVREGTGSVNLLTRKLRVGWRRAGVLIDELEARGVVAPADPEQPRAARPVLVTAEQVEAMIQTWGSEVSG